MTPEALERIRKLVEAGDTVWDGQVLSYDGSDFYDENESIDPYFAEDLMKHFIALYNANRDLKSLLEAYEAMREAMNTILVASEFHSQQGLADYVMRYAHENNVRLIKQTLGVCEATERSEDNDE